MTNFIPYAKQSIDEEDLKAVTEALKSDYLTSGPKVQEFEERFAETVGAPYAVAVSSGTAALHLAYAAAGLTKGSHFLTTPLTFAATANAALYLGARVRFTDIDDSSGNIHLKAILPHNKTDLVAVVHYGGNPVDMRRLPWTMGGLHPIVVEDACHALGAAFNKVPVGSCAHSHMTVFSFHPVKHITTGEGGMITTRDEGLYEKLKLLRSHGIEADKEKGWVRNMTCLGYNYRLTDFQCALGISQLKKLPRFLERRREIASRYDEAFKDVDKLTLLAARPWEGGLHAYHLYALLLDRGIDRAKFINEAKERGIGLQVHYGSILEHPYYKQTLGLKNKCPRAKEFGERVVSLPMYPDLTEEEQRYVIETVLRLIKS